MRCTAIASMPEMKKHQPKFTDRLYSKMQQMLRLDRAYNLALELECSDPEVIQQAVQQN